MSGETKSARLPACDCLNDCGDDRQVHNGQAAPCEYLARMQEERRRCETIQWVNPTPLTMPDAGDTVLLELQGDSEPTWPGYWDGIAWISSDGMPITSSVSGWAHMPKGRTPK